MIIIFEDNENTPSSRLLSSCYYGSNIVFSGGASQLSIKIFEKLQEDDVMVFVDVVPNNEYTVSTYRKLKKYIKTAGSEILPFLIFLKNAAVYFIIIIEKYEYI